MFLVDQQQKGLRDGEQAKHHDDQIDTGAEPGLIKGEALGIFDRLQPDGGEEDTETGQHAGGQDLSTMGQDNQNDAHQGCQKNLSRAKMRRNPGQNRRENDQA